ncbi:nucleotide-binding universal stress UspA family protein [Streptomyces sp. SAI-133]|uniref:universal stress protein n=1 Tax=unclassified Streptomyces TaxID=2593676 RepID=UPI002474B434|nr:universal stress protein [Streptomyces sp. SAI-133]MDH6588964.1 nucleotide-binding universal stress UspA family protein [Streptomyces sp. SAI-133]
MPGIVMVGLDGSPESVAAAQWAADDALSRAAPLCLVHAGDQPPYDYVPFAGEAVAPPDADRAAHMLREIAAVLAYRRPGLHLTTARLSGRPAAALTEAARGAELLVLGSRGLGRAAGYLLGSVASAVLARAERPVVLVRATAGQRPHPGGTAAPPGPRRDVVLGLDLRDRPAETVLEFAFDMAARRRTGLRVLHGWSSSGAPDDGGRQMPQTGAGEALADALWPWREKFPRVDVAVETVVGTAGSHLVDASREAVLVVVGRRRRPALLGPHIGPVTHQVLRAALSPVAVVTHD